jgi:hypothetical protein
MQGMHRLGITLLAMLAATSVEAASRIAESGRYICADGGSLIFDRRGYGPVLLRDGRQVRLVQRWVFNGFRFVGEGMDLRGRGTEGAKTVTLRDGGGPEILCRAVPAGRSPGIVTGQLVAPAIAIPADGRVQVMLHSARSPGQLLGHVEILPSGRSWPLAYWLSYPAAVVDGQLTARVLDRAGRPLARTATPTSLPRRSDGRHASADLTLAPLRAASAPSSK